MIKNIVIFLFLLVHFHLCDRDLNLRRNSSSDRGFGSGIYDSFLKLKKKIKSYFYISFDNLERRRQKIKTSFYNFIHESFRNGKKSNLSAISFADDTLDAGMSLSQMVTLDGYRVESHTVLTLDGYILTIHRIKPQQNEVSKKSLVLMFHGLLGSSDDWVLLGTGKGLPYLLSDAGYDVWLANARGNKYSRTHQSKLLDTPEFWNFSWHEIGLYDLPAVIEYIVGVTGGNRKINFIGHSMGATVLLVLLSTSPQFNTLLRSAVLLAPLAFMYHVKGPLKTLAKNYNRNTANYLGRHEFDSTLGIVKELSNSFCLDDINMCSNTLLLLASGGRGAWNPRVVESILSHVTAGASAKTIAHYLQLINSGDFRNYDYGIKKNLKKYGAASAPVYKLQNISVPIIIFSSIDDWLSTTPDVTTLMTRLSSIYVHHVVKSRDFSHVDFVWSDGAPDLVYYPILEVLERAALEISSA